MTAMPPKAPTTQAPAHDPKVCGIDYATSCELCRPDVLRAGRVMHLDDRLRKSSILPGDLAALISPFLSDAIDRLVERLVEEKLRAALKGVRLTATIDTTHIGELP